VHNVRDISGRPGIAVSRTTDGITVTDIFDPRTFTYLGQTVDNHGHTDGSALLTIAIANQPGQQP
jgi:hypothetical protein